MARRRAQPLDLLPPKLVDLFFQPGRMDGEAIYAPSRYKVAYGGRGSAKSWGFATMAIMLGCANPLRFLCVRELQNSIAASVHQLLSDTIDRLSLNDFYKVTRESIVGQNGTQFLFVGVKNDPGKIKSTEGVDILFIEEAEKISAVSWRILPPTIRKAGSEIWVVFNPREEDDPTYERFVKHMPPRSRRVKINWNDNPWFPPEIALERRYALQLIEDAKRAEDDGAVVQLQADYDHVWEGECLTFSNARILYHKVVIEPFDEPPERTRIHLGCDWGFAEDPTALIRFWTTKHREDGIDWEELWISHEAYGTRVDLGPDTAKLFDAVPGARSWPIKADNARPESISAMARQGFNIAAAEKWQGSLEDGIAHLKMFRRIHIHPRCRRIAMEAKLYSYKVDPVTNDVLPIVVDAHNHGLDAVRYGLDGFIQRRGVHQQWAKLAQ